MTLVTAWRHSKRPTCCRSWLAAAILAAAAPQSASAAADEPSCRPSDWFRGCTVSLVVENDLVSGTDRNYTSGVALRLTSSEGDVPDLISRAAAPFIAPGARLRATYAIGQNLYTPENIETATPDPDDRPYGAWLYGSVGLLADAGDSLTSLELSIGVVGPMALGEETQTRVHEAIGSPKPLGWDSQLDNEPALLLTAEHKWQTRLIGRLFGFGLDVAPYVGGAVGNVFTYADAGLTLGWAWTCPRTTGRHASSRVRRARAISRRSAPPAAPTCLPASRRARCCTTSFSTAISCPIHRRSTGRPPSATSIRVSRSITAMCGSATRTCSGRRSSTARTISTRLARLASPFASEHAGRLRGTRAAPMFQPVPEPRCRTR